MKILVICQYYHPEPFRIADMCETLVQQGHKVSVVTGTPNYPMGEIYPGYENGQRMDEVLNGVKVHRCIIAPRKTGSLNRLKNYFSYALESSKYVKHLPGDFDVVLVNQLSPVMMAEAGIRYKRKHHKKLVLYCLDLWPESLCAGGIKKDSLIYNVFKVISKRIYKAADEILATSRMFSDYLEDMFGVETERIHYLPQYAEAQFLELKEKEVTDTFNLLFAGNIGVTQSLETVIDAAKLLMGEKIHFHIVGDGVALKGLKKLAAGLNNITFYGRKPLEDMPQYYALADAMLVTLIDDPVISRTLPGKVQTYMAAGKPIVGAINGEAAFVLQDAQGGYCGAAGDAATLVSNIMHLAGSKRLRDIGAKNREYYLHNFSKSKFIESLISHLG